MLDYAHEFHRMCKTFRSSRGQKLCKGCPLAKKPCDMYNITSEHVKLVQAWSDAHPEIRLTAKQHEVLKAMHLLGFKYIAKDANGKTYIYTSRPVKGGIAWLYTEGESAGVRYLNPQAVAISPLVEWEDKEPLNIEEVLKNGDNNGAERTGDTSGGVKNRRKTVSGAQKVD